jgi:hypothetical protein
MQFKIQQETLNKILGYLALRPYSEVALLIKEIQDGVEAMGDVVENDSEGV